MNRAILVLWAVAVGLPLALALTLNAQAEPEKIKVLIVTGQNNHAWYNMAPAMKEILDAAGLFDVTIAQTPSKHAPPEQWDHFNPKFTDYKVVLIDYNDTYPRNDPGDRWPARVDKAFESYIRHGGRALSVHAGNNAFDGWIEYEQMIGLLWRNNKQGDRIYIDHDGHEVRVPKGKGPGAGHGPRHEYVMEHRDTEHPVFKGLPKRWLHAEDELYHGQRGPAQNMHICATAHSAKNQRGTGVHEPMIWQIPYHDGLVMTNVMGHWGRGKNETGIPLRCAGFQTILCRSVEYLATGKVTQPVPDDFPTEDKVSLRPPFKFEPLIEE